MSKEINRAKEVIKDYIRNSSMNETIVIRIENIQENVDIFNRALNSPDIQRMLLQQNKRVSFQLIQSGFEQVKSYMFRTIQQATSDVGEMIFPCLLEDTADYYAALDDSEIQSLLEQKNMTASIRVVTKDGKALPDIIVATVDDIKSGKLDDFLK